MPTETTDKATPKPRGGRRETWRDWARARIGPEPAPADLLTREQLLARLAADGLPVKERELRYLQDVGLVPLPTLQRRDGRRLGVFPPWVANLVKWILVLHRKGDLGWEEIRPLVPSRDRADYRGLIPDIEGLIAWPIPRDLVPNIVQLGQWYTRAYEEPRTIRLVFTDRDGQERTFEFPW